MTALPNENQAQQTTDDSKERNFRAFEAKMKRELEQERSARIEAERIAQEALSKRQSVSEDDEDDNEPYVDKRKLNKTLAKFGEQTKQQTHGEIQKAVQNALQEERKSMWLKQNSDFYDVLEHADKLALRNPDLAETILEMPESFERQKLVYKNIKALGLDKPEQKQQTIQEKVDANRRSPFYQPTGVGAPPYASAGDFSPQGQKQAYEKMKELKSRLRI